MTNTVILLEVKQVMTELIRLPPGTNTMLPGLIQRSTVREEKRLQLSWLTCVGLGAEILIIYLIECAFLEAF